MNYTIYSLRRNYERKNTDFILYYYQIIRSNRIKNTHIPKNKTVGNKAIIRQPWHPQHIEGIVLPFPMRSS
jgi:hypothetical protein